jgi:hypothetical protein
MTVKYAFVPHIFGQGNGARDDHAGWVVLLWVVTNVWKESNATIFSAEVEFCNSKTYSILNKTSDEVSKNVAWSKYDVKRDEGTNRQTHLREVSVTIRLAADWREGGVLYTRASVLEQHLLLNNNNNNNNTAEYRISLFDTQSCYNDRTLTTESSSVSQMHQHTW